MPMETILLLMSALLLDSEAAPEAQAPPVSCTDWPVDGTIDLPADRPVLAAALRSLNRASARREFSREQEAAPMLAGILLIDGLIDPVEKDVLCEMTNPERGGRVTLSIEGEPSEEIWAHAGYTEDIMRGALKGIVPEIPDILR